MSFRQFLTTLPATTCDYGKFNMSSLEPMGARSHILTSSCDFGMCSLTPIGVRSQIPSCSVACSSSEFKADERLFPSSSIPHESLASAHSTQTESTALIPSLALTVSSQSSVESVPTEIAAGVDGSKIIGVKVNVTDIHGGQYGRRGVGITEHDVSSSSGPRRGTDSAEEKFITAVRRTGVLHDSLLRNGLRAAKEEVKINEIGQARVGNHIRLADITLVYALAEGEGEMQGGLMSPEKFHPTPFFIHWIRPCQWRVVKCCDVSWGLLSAVHTRCTQKEPVTRMETRETEPIAVTHERATRYPLHTGLTMCSVATEFCGRNCAVGILHFLRFPGSCILLIFSSKELRYLAQRASSALFHHHARAYRESKSIVNPLLLRREDEDCNVFANVRKENGSDATNTPRRHDLADNGRESLRTLLTTYRTADRNSASFTLDVGIVGKISSGMADNLGHNKAGDVSNVPGLAFSRQNSATVMLACIKVFENQYRQPFCVKQMALAYANDELETRIITRSRFPDDTQFISAQRKGVFPCDFVKSMESLSRPRTDAFHNIMKGKGIGDTNYAHAQSAWNEFNCQNLLKYTMHYLDVDMCLLADVFENFRTVCFNGYKLDPAMYAAAPSLSWDALFLNTDARLEFFSLSVGSEMVLPRFQKGIRK
ncbi:hypothetical protein PR048_014714 [Dryococelus australis]|uniref:DNA-directed DNA polymerase n=1 Tax=Dryococelus australis TaxID=614101 RepID=A0ABQ9HFE5_9NEOP|nr:hypothetical protein PR048_014714 [Dryococelus australis]